jgi:K+ transporter
VLFLVRLDNQGEGGTLSGASTKSV